MATVGGQWAEAEEGKRPRFSFRDIGGDKMKLLAGEEAKQNDLGLYLTTRVGR